MQISRTRNFLQNVNQIRICATIFTEVLLPERGEILSGKEFFDEKIADITKSIMSYCVTRTSNRYDAEDLAQDIIVQLVKSVDNIRDDKAFYGFMWAVAGKVYAMWCRKRAKADVSQLPESLPDTTDYFDIDDAGDLYLLRRELTLLSEKYRKAVILYYLQNKSCAQISSVLGISENMVKYLLFKARQILKEGMNMERNYGEQSYNPKKLMLMYMGEGPNQFDKLINSPNGKISQNILWACYNDSLTAEEISLQIGVALPYLEAEIKALTNVRLLIQNGNKYSTNIIIFTDEFKAEVTAKVEKNQETIGDTIYEFIIANEDKIRGIGFHMCDMSKNSLLWHVTCWAMWLLFSKINENLPEWPVTAFGEKAFVWGVESASGILNCCTLGNDEFGHDAGIDKGRMYCLDYLPTQKTTHTYFYCNRKITNFYLKFAAGMVHSPNEYEQEFIADLIRRGYFENNGGILRVTTPVYTREQAEKLYALLLPVVDEAFLLAADIQKNAETVLKNHVPAHLKKQTHGIICMRMFDDVVGATVEAMRRNDYLKISWNAAEIPTACIIL